MMSKFEVEYALLRDDSALIQQRSGDGLLAVGFLKYFIFGRFFS